MGGTSSNNINWGRNLFIAAFGTTVLAPVEYESCISLAPSTIVEYQNIPQDQWEERTMASIDIDQNDFNSLKSFSKNLLENTHDIDSDILEVVNNKFWDLI